MGVRGSLGTVAVGCCARFLEPHSGDTPFRQPQGVHLQQSDQLPRVSCCPDAHAMSHYLLTSGVQGAPPHKRQLIIHQS